MGKLLSLLFAASMLPVMSAHAASFGTRLEKQCPAAYAWMTANALKDHNAKRAAANGNKHHYDDPTLRAELAKRYSNDQVVRHEWIASHYDKVSGKAMEDIDANNLAWLKPLIAKHGFPTISQVGKTGVLDAFMLVQHATRDPTLQAQVLRDIKPRLKSEGISGENFAMLTDRVRVEQGKPQIYGTQFFVPSGKNGKLRTNLVGTPDLQMRPLEDPKHVDQRRASMALMPLADYKCVLDVMYTPQATPRASR